MIAATQATATIGPTMTPTLRDFRRVSVILDLLECNELGDWRKLQWEETDVELGVIPMAALILSSATNCPHGERVVEEGPMRLEEN